MKNLLNPRWLFLINTLPLILLFAIFFSDYQIIRSLLTEINLSYWSAFGYTLAGLGMIHLMYAGILIYLKKEISYIYAFLALIIHICYICLYFKNEHYILPSSIPRWLLSGNIELYVLTFLMPTLAYAVLILVIHFTKESSSIMKNVLVTVLIPVCWYAFFRISLLGDHDFGMAITLVMSIGSILLFLFFLIRTIYVLTLKQSEKLQKYQLAWKIPITIILPIIGLCVNNGIFFGYSIFDDGIFGNFNDPWYYILAVLNGLLICAPNTENKNYRLALFIGRTMTFTYTLYFFFVFLPFLPFSVIAIIALGGGFLMLAPLILFVLHVNELHRDYKFLLLSFPKKWLISTSILSFMILPLCLTLTYVHDRAVLNEALAYIYKPDFSAKTELDTKSLHNTLGIIKKHKEKNNNDLWGGGTPYLASYYNWLVLDNLTLSTAKTEQIEQIFFNIKPVETRTGNVQDTRDDVLISDIKSTSRFDASQNAWISWIDLNLADQGRETWQSEYQTILNLPDGCWISDYYLYVGDKKEMGILAEKKSALWVFNQIKNTRRDPGILHYLSGNQVAFRVFPFASKEVRKTGIQLIHKEPFLLKIDDKEIMLGDDRHAVQGKTENDDMVYLSTAAKKALPFVNRKPYYHFLVDISASQYNKKTQHIKNIDQLLSCNSIPAQHAKISLVDAYTTTSELTGNWKRRIENTASEGGFYLERAIKTTLFQAYKTNSNTYPVIVVVTDSLHEAISQNSYADFKITYPESDFIYHLKPDGTLDKVSLLNSSIIPNQSIQGNNQVYAYPDAQKPSAYLSTEENPAIILKNTTFEVQETSLKEKNWDAGLMLQGKWMSLSLHPENTDKEWLNLVKYSFKSKIMSPVTSYLVVETEAQKAMLLKKQAQILKSNPVLDLDDEPINMPEPELLILMIILGSMIAYKKRNELKAVWRNQFIKIYESLK